MIRRLVLLFVLVVVLLVGIGAGVVLDRFIGPVAAAPGSGEGINTRLLQETWNLIQKNYVDRQAIQPVTMTYGALAGMVNALGDTGHSTFMTPEMVEEQRNYTQGHFEGIGANVEMRNGMVVIAAPIDGSPAQKAGIRPGEIILKVDGKDMTGLGLEEVVSHVLGPAGSQVTLTLGDPKTGKTREIKITRARITVPSVTWTFVPGTKIAHVRLAAFSENAVKDMQGALTGVQKQGATGVVLDLRNNPGGLLDGAIGVASQFLKGGNVLQVKDAQGKMTPVGVKSDVPKTDLPVVVIVNQGTASAAEIVAGALKDQGRAKVIGEKTFGTGTVLNQFPLSDGSAVMLAVQEWLTPRGQSIWHHGIEPDETVALPAETNSLLPEEEKSFSPEQYRAANDKQLQRAVELLGQK